MTTQGTAAFIHRFVPAAGGDDVTLLLLHGTGGDESDLLPVASLLRPGAAVFSPRGKVLEHGMPRFFRRLAEGVFDHEDLVARTHELAAWVRAAVAENGRAADRVVAVGFSNGANIAASLLLLHPGLLRGAVLFRAMVPFEPQAAPDLAGTAVFLGEGAQDPLIPPALGERLAQILRDGGADVTLRWQPGGHALTRPDVEAAAAWLAAAFPEPAP
jgi:predicted esterase